MKRPDTYARAHGIDRGDVAVAAEMEIVRVKSKPRGRISLDQRGVSILSNKNMFLKIADGFRCLVIFQVTFVRK